MIRVMLVDDHPVVRAGYRRLLEQAGDVCVQAEAATGEEAYRLHGAGPAPDVTVTDLSMPGAGGLELVRRLLARDAQARVLVFSMHDSQALVQRAFDAGAVGFVSKTAPPESLLDAVRAAARGTRQATGAAVPGAPAQDAQLLAQLTEREFALFCLLAQGHSVAECAAILNLSAKTASNYQTLIKDKLGVATTAAMAHMALRNGLLPPVQQ